MTDGDQTGEPAAFPVNEAFALIGDDLRAEILRVLGEHPHEGLSFSALRERVDPDVDSGQFNYHLQKLVGPFVERTDDGYELRATGLALYRAIQAGTFNREVTVEPFAAGFDCYYCETPVEALYEDGTFEMVCPGCGHTYTTSRLPPSAVEGDREAFLRRVDQYNRHHFLASARGVCPICACEVDLGFVRGEEVWAEGTDRHDVMVHRECPNCGREHYMLLGMALLYHPTPVSFYREHGHDLTAIPHWKLEWVMTDATLTVLSEDPWRFELRVPCDGDVVALTVNDELTVVETRSE